MAQQLVAPAHTESQDNKKPRRDRGLCNLLRLRAKPCQRAGYPQGDPNLCDISQKNVGEAKKVAQIPAQFGPASPPIEADLARLAAVLMRLSADDRVRLAALLVSEQQAQDPGKTEADQEVG
jgi:hypothetical protein